MDIKKKELGENIIINLDYKRYKEFLLKVKKLAKEGEYNSNVNNIKYSVVFNGRKRPYMDVKGWCSRAIDKSGKISEVVFVDYDDILWELVESELLYIQKRYNLSPFYIFKSTEQKSPDGKTYGNYLAVSISKQTFKKVFEILGELHCDISYRVVPTSYKFKTWVTRLSNKGAKKAPTFKCIVGDLTKKYNQDCSQAHLETMQKVYPDIPKIKYTNLDGNHTIYLTQYKTASKQEIKIGSLEELFIRVETAKKTDFDDIVDWLSDSGRKNKDSYKNVATILQEPFSLQQQAKKIDATDFTNADKLRELKSDADNLDIELGMGRVDTINKIQQKLDVIEKAETEQVEKQEQAIAEREALKQEIAESETREELKRAEKALGEVSPQALGGLKSGETRRVPKAFATLFE